MRILGLDLGEKNIGLAISDELGWTAQGLPTLRRRDNGQVIKEIIQVVEEKKVGEIVVGMPINLDGSLGKKAKEIASFIEELKKELQIPVKIWDERFSTMQAEKIMLEADLSRKKRKKNIDRMAAQIILQNYLDARAGT